ncbi:hypothetical protein E8D34_09715 [Nocardioides sp. GY 10113]|uniref:hypothetical protein n=1 Tax=Nocardioides sp. GY 10113 TaxID=2569761 RepID=UPI0010A872A2|nr:hypothetical protein [Nocardioides sp. GY 10113]TIC87399.1 hypothetical protein E8D34_09715 [Nocardioides sp. GY 10113]
MGHRVFLHIGAPKSGTTYLQSLLWTNREHLRARGLLFPGRRPFEQNRASIEVRSGRHLRGEADVWQRFVRRSRQFDGDTILSNEWYVAASPEQVEGMVRDLGEDRVHVVVTARHLLAQVPAGWQEELKLGSGASLDAFLAQLDDPTAKWRWGVLDPAVGVEPWAAVLPPERIHVVTVPTSAADPELLWRRFLGVTGADAAGTDTGVARRNESLGAESARLLQEIGPDLLAATDPGTTPWNERYRWIRNKVAHEVLVPLGGSPIGLRPADAAAIQERAEQSVARISAAGYDLVGDPQDLLTARVRSGAVHPDDVDVREVLRRAGVVSGALLREVRAASTGS